ncbi:hypothetical protein BDF14DRAFT_1838198 [Spinellus fusiger]|nr:hypothetical protein BDF14DRAFT_1838198 [Spinellus fusiger]
MFSKLRSPPPCHSESIPEQQKQEQEQESNTTATDDLSKPVSCPTVLVNNQQEPLADVHLLSSSTESCETASLPAHLSSDSELHFYEGGVRSRHIIFVKWLGRTGFIAKGIVYGSISVLTCTNVTGAWTPNGSQNNESPQGAFLLLGGIPAIGRPILVIMAIGLITYIVWRFWEAITGQGQDASLGKKANLFRSRLSPFVSGCVYSAYTYYVIQMIYQTNEQQQATASSKEFPASWTVSAIGRTGIALLGIAFLIATLTQLVNAATGNFIKDLKTSSPEARRWEALIVHTAGRIGFIARAAVFCTMSGFFWDSLAKRNESGRQNMIAAALSKLAATQGGRFFMMLLGIGLVIYALFAISNAHYKYFPTPPPSRVSVYENTSGTGMCQEESVDKKKGKTYRRWLPWSSHGGSPVEPQSEYKLPWWRWWSPTKPTDIEKRG